MAWKIPECNKQTGGIRICNRGRCHSGVAPPKRGLRPTGQLPLPRWRHPVPSLMTSFGPEDGQLPNTVLESHTTDLYLWPRPMAVSPIFTAMAALSSALASKHTADAGPNRRQASETGCTHPSAFLLPKSIAVDRMPRAVVEMHSSPAFTCNRRAHPRVWFRGITAGLAARRPHNATFRVW